MSADRLSLHAGCVLVGEAGILIRGPAGVGKSTLARRLVEAHRATGRFAALVADDRVLLRRAHGRLVAEPHPAIAGRIEIRGWGIVEMPSERAAVLRLVVDLSTSDGPRMPDRSDVSTTLHGVELPRIKGQLSTIAPLVEAALSWPR